MDNKAGKKTNEDDNIEFEEINDGPMRRNPVNEKSNILLKKVNKPEEGLTVSQSQQLDNTLKEHQRLTRRD
jgi:hypothetical protein